MPRRPQKSPRRGADAIGGANIDAKLQSADGVFSFRTRRYDCSCASFEADVAGDRGAFFALGVAVLKLQLGILVCLLAACATQSTNADPPSRADVDARLASFVATPFVLRIGIEHLPPDADGATDPMPSVESQPRLAHTPPAPVPTMRRDRRDEPDAAHRRTWALSDDDLNAIDDPIARETLHFVQDLVDADLERARREVTMPFLGVHDQDPTAGPLLQSELELLEAQEEWLQDRGPSLMRRPIRQLLRRLPFVEQIELEFDEWRSDHLPLTESHRLPYDEPRRSGRVSVRVRVSDPGDPLEIAYVYSGVRVGSSQDRAKVSLDFDLSATVRVALRASSDYADHERHLRADIAYRPSAWTSLHVSIGDDMDFLSTSSIYSLFETPMDGSAGLLLYAVHLF